MMLFISRARGIHALLTNFSRAKLKCCFILLVSRRRVSPRFGDKIVGWKKWSFVSLLWILKIVCGLSACICKTIIVSKFSLGVVSGKICLASKCLRSSSVMKSEISKILWNIHVGGFSRAENLRISLSDANFNALRRRCDHFSLRVTCRDGPDLPSK